MQTFNNKHRPLEHRKPPQYYSISSKSWLYRRKSANFYGAMSSRIRLRRTLSYTVAPHSISSCGYGLQELSLRWTQIRDTIKRWRRWPSTIQHQTTIRFWLMVNDPTVKSNLRSIRKINRRSSRTCCTLLSSETLRLATSREWIL